MEAKVKMIERVEQGEKMVDVAHSYNVYCSTTGVILKNKDKIMECVKFAVPIMLTIISKKRGKVMEEMEKLLSVDAGSASASSPAQLNADSREN